MNQAAQAPTLAWSYTPSNTELPYPVMVVPNATPEHPYLTFSEHPDELPLDAKATILEWTDWHLAPIVHCIGEQKCEQCGQGGQQWMSRGYTVPKPGETVTVERAKHARRSGRLYYTTEEVPEWRTWRLHAFMCAWCRHLDVYWTGPDGTSWHEVNPTPPDQGALW